ncbi:hypothetical protein CVT24_003959 [Panaeolus cyanescens]|uniref:Tyrosine--tRNA ligase n=1 Tax=Panaeolus cyanescens TaxID=181874 RepID=A0A409Y6G4_9AGAR|nr:hypothetical protein CVT24_003959 [Panaeolus cyanescens]
MLLRQAPRRWPSCFLNLRRLYHTQKPILDDLSERGFIQDVTRRDALERAVGTHKQTVYAGVDPTAKALHIGHLLPLMCLLHFKIRGHDVIPLIGGATGRVGDPSGRLTERDPADIKQVEENVTSLTNGLQTFFQRALLYASARQQSSSINSEEEIQVISNLSWHQSFTMLDFLQKVGIYARVNTMMNRESVRARLESQQGLSFTEFTYQLLQAYDFYHLNKHFGCTIQVGGSDQWGNIVAGLELIGKLSATDANESPSAFGITTPLLTTTRGEKFGKSAGNAVWMDSSLTSVFDFYQYFLKVPDADVGTYLRLFTLLPSDHINRILVEHATEPEKHIAQTLLAREVTEMVHYKDGVVQASTITALLFSSDYTNLKAEDILLALRDDPRLVRISRSELFETPVTKLAAKYGLTPSNSASRTLLSSGGLYLNNVPLLDAQAKITAHDLLDQRVAILRAGKSKLMTFVTDP